MRIGRPGRVGALATVLVVAAGCAQPTAGAPVPDQKAADAITVEAGIKAFQDHFADLGDEHARVFNYLNYGGTRITTEHESHKFGDPPVTVLERRQDEDADSSAILHPPNDPLDYVRLDERHSHLAPTPWVSVPTLYAGGFETCFLLTAWLACHLDSALTQTGLDAKDRQPAQVRETEDGTEVTTGALLGLMLEEGFITVPEEERDQITERMRDEMVPVTIRLDTDLKFTGFEIRGKITDGDATPLELQIGYEVLGESDENDFPDMPPAAEITNIPDPVAADAFWQEFNARKPAG